MSRQFGFAPIAVIIALVIAALAGGGYFLSSKTSPSSPKSINSPVELDLPGVVLNPDCKYNDPDFCKFFNNWQNIKNYSIKSAMTSGNNTTNSTFELSGEDKFHISASEKGKEIYSIISIGDITYTKDYSDNKWWKQKEGKTVANLKDKAEFKVAEDDGEDKATYKSSGKEACGARQCFKYQIINSEMSDVKEYIWFDDKEYLLRKNRSEAEGGISESEFFYNQVNIVEPSPLKEATPGQVVIPGAGAVPGFSQEDWKQIQEESKKVIESQPKDYQIQPVLD